MSDAKKRLANAIDARSESYEDRQAREAQERDAVNAFFEQVIVPGFEAAANAINERETAIQSRREPPSRAETRRGPHGPDGMSMDLTVRKGQESQFWFRGIVKRKPLPFDWTYRRNPRIRNDGTLTSEGTEKELKWPVAMAEWTPDHVSNDLIDRYAQVVEVRNKRRVR